MSESMRDRLKLEDDQCPFLCAGCGMTERLRARKEGIESLQKQVETLEAVIKLADEQLTEGFESKDLSYDTQSVNWVHKHLAQALKDRGQ